MLFIILYNSGISDDILNMTKEELLRLDCNFTKFVKKALHP